MRRTSRWPEERLTLARPWRNFFSSIGVRICHFSVVQSLCYLYLPITSEVQHLQQSCVSQASSFDNCRGLPTKQDTSRGAHRHPCHPLISGIWFHWREWPHLPGASSSSSFLASPAKQSTWSVAKGLLGQKRRFTWRPAKCT